MIFFVGFAAGFFAGFDDLGRAFVTLGRDPFFARALDFAGFLELFFFAELAIKLGDALG